MKSMNSSCGCCFRCVVDFEDGKERSRKKSYETTENERDGCGDESWRERWKLSASIGAADW